MKSACARGEPSRLQPREGGVRPRGTKAVLESSGHPGQAEGPRELTASRGTARITRYCRRGSSLYRCRSVSSSARSRLLLKRFTCATGALGSHAPPGCPAPRPAFSLPGDHFRSPRSSCDTSRPGSAWDPRPLSPFGRGWRRARPRSRPCPEASSGARRTGRRRWGCPRPEHRAGSLGRGLGPRSINSRSRLLAPGTAPCASGNRVGGAPSSMVTRHTGFAGRLAQTRGPRF